MSINFNLKKILVASAALLMALSAGAGTGNVANAKHRRYHYRTHRTYRVRRHRARRVGRTRRTRRNHRSRYGYIYGHKLYYLNKPARRTHRSQRTRRHYRRHVSGVSQSLGNYSGTRSWSKRRPRRHVIRRHRTAKRYAKHARVRHYSYRPATYVKPAKPAVQPNYHQEEIDDLKDEGEVPMSTQSEIQAQEQAAREQTLTDINNDRASLGEEPFTEDPTLDKLAQERAWQLDHVAYSHTDANNYGEPYTVEDGGPYVGAENIDQTGDSNQDGYGVNGKQGANEANDTLFNDEKPSYDEPQGGGHYMSLTTQGTSPIGIGAYYNGQDGTGYSIAEDIG